MSKKFVFSLATLKRYRENRLLLARKELIQVEGKLHELTGAQRRAVVDRSDMIGVSDVTKGAAGMAFLHADLVSSETARIRMLDKQIAEVEEERDRHARWVTHLGRELKAIERLEEKKREAFDAEKRLIEKRGMDNWVAERWSHGASARNAGAETGSKEDPAA